MRANITKAVRQVLTEASNTVHFMDFSEKERINWLIERAYQLGAGDHAKPVQATRPTKVRRRAHSHEPRK